MTNKMNTSNGLDMGENDKHLIKENVTTDSQEMDKESATLESPGDKGKNDQDSSKVQENDIKTDSPSEELIDSIEEVLNLGRGSVNEKGTVLGDIKDDSNEMSMINDHKTTDMVDNKGQLSSVSVNNEHKQAEIGGNGVSNEEKEHNFETTVQENVEIKDISTDSMPETLGDSKDSNVIEGVTVTSVTKEEKTDNVEMLIGAIGGTETNAQHKDEDGDDDFRAMTEDEIQAIIRKYSFMDPEVRSRSLRFFWSLDVDRWGYFNVTHLRYWYRVQGSILTDSQISRIFVDLDKDHDSLVSLDEFLDEMSKKRPRRLRQDELREMFESWDMNKDGYVCESDLRDKMESMNKVPCTYDIYQALSYDTREQRRLNYHDFCRYAQDAVLQNMPIQQW